MEVALKVPPLEEADTVVLDPRATRLHPRPISLLTVEARQLQSLLTATDASARDRPLLLRRIAEDNVELASAAESEVRAAAESGDDATVRAKRGVAISARRAAIDAYRALVVQTWNVPYAKMDEAEWYLALECARAGDVEWAQYAYRLVREHPTSPFTPRAYLLFGALFAAQATTDPSKHAAAAQAFSRAAQSSNAELAQRAHVRLERESPAAGDPASEVPTTTPPVATDRGCTTDLQCKGARICQGGKCVDPSE